MSYISPEGLLGLSISFMNLTTVLLLMRYITNRMTKRAIGLDDLALTISWLFTTAMCINMISAVAFRRWGYTLAPALDADGNFDPILGFSQEQSDSAKFFYAQQILLVLQVVSAKLSIVFFYRRALVTRGERSGFTHWATMGTIGALAVWATILVFMYAFQCGSRFSLIWDGPIAEEVAVCVDGEKLELGFIISDFLFDILIAILPLRRVFTLKLSPSKKLQVAAAFMIGALSVAGAAVRLATYISVINMVENSLTTLTQGDPGLLQSLLMFWGMFEAGFGLTCAIMPGLRPLINRVAKAFDEKLSTFRSKTLRSESSFSDTAPLSVKVSYEVHVSSAAREV